MNPKPTVASTAGLRISETLLAILGAVALLLGGLVLFAGDETYVGLGGDASWRVGDIALAWGITLLAVGVVIVLADAALVRWDRTHVVGVTARTSAVADFAVHATMFVLVNAFVWLQDIALGEGVNYAWWITIPWGIGLIAHAFSTFTGDRR